MLPGLRRDRELGFMVTLMASMLLAPLLWDRHLAMLLPSALLAGRGHPWALLPPVAAWLPLLEGARTFLYPLTVISAIALLVRDPEPAEATSPMAVATT